jgi:hypothetical protein
MPVVDIPILRPDTPRRRPERAIHGLGLRDISFSLTIRVATLPTLPHPGRARHDVLVRIFFRRTHNGPPVVRRAVCGRVVPLAARFVQSSNRKVCMAVQIDALNGFLIFLDYGQCTRSSVTNGTRATRSRFADHRAWLGPIRVQNPVPSRQKEPRPGKIVSLPAARHLRLVPASEHRREDGLMCVRLPASFLSLAQRRSRSSKEYHHGRSPRWVLLPRKTDQPCSRMIRLNSSRFWRGGSDLR